MGSVSSSDKNKLILVGTFVALIVMVVIFFNISRMLPLLYLAVFLLAVELIFTMPAVCKEYYALYGSEVGFVRFIPGYNIILVAPKAMAITLIAVTVVTAILAYLAFGPMFWVTASNAVFFANVANSSLGLFILAILILSIVIGVCYSRVYSDVLQMREDFTGGSLSKLEAVYYVMLYVPLLRGFALMNLYNYAKTMTSVGFVVGNQETFEDLEEEYVND